MFLLNGLTIKVLWLLFLASILGSLSSSLLDPKVKGNCGLQTSKKVMYRDLLKNNNQA